MENNEDQSKKLYSKEILERGMERQRQIHEMAHELYDGIKSLNNKLDTMTSHLEEPLVEESNESITTLEERLSIMEKQMLIIQQKDVERDMVIDHLAILTTRLEAKINMVINQRSISLLLQNEE